MRKFFAAVLILVSSTAYSETVDVKYRGRLDLKPFQCKDTVSSFVRRICYDEQQKYMLIDLQGTWYNYCGIDSRTVASLISAESVGRFYNSHIKGTGKDGPFDCRTHRVPVYNDGCDRNCVALGRLLASFATSETRR